MGTVVHFELRVPTKWEKTHLPVILITGEDWNPMEEVLRPSLLTKEEVEMRKIRSLSTRHNAQFMRAVQELKSKTRRN